MKVLIFIKDLSFEAVIGILPKERQKEQKINLSVKIKYHYSDFGGYINYAEVADTIMKCVKTKHYGLLEEALKDIAVTCFNFFLLKCPECNPYLINNYCNECIYFLNVF